MYVCMHMIYAYHKHINTWINTTMHINVIYTKYTKNKEKINLQQIKLQINLQYYIIVIYSVKCWSFLKVIFNSVIKLFVFFKIKFVTM